MEETNNGLNDDQIKGMNIPKISGISIMALFILLGMGFDKLGSFVDIPSLQIVVVGTIAALFASNKFEDIINLLPVIKGDIKPQSEKELRSYIRITELGSRFAIALGAVGTLVGLILMLGNMSDVSSIGPNMAVALITSLYGIMFSELVFMPIKGHILSIYTENQNSIEVKSEEPFSESVQKVQSEKETKFGVILLAISLPIIAFFILLLSMSDIKWGDERVTDWQRININEIQLNKYEVSYSNSKEELFSLCEDSTSLAGISRRIYFPTVMQKKENKFFYPKLYIEPLSKLNSKQSKLSFTIDFENPERDSADYRNRFSYHVTLDTVNHILVEDGDYRIEFDIIPKSIEKATTTPSVSSTLSPIDEE